MVNQESRRNNIPSERVIALPPAAKSLAADPCPQSGHGALLALLALPARSPARNPPSLPATSPSSPSLGAATADLPPEERNRIRIILIVREPQDRARPAHLPAPPACQPAATLPACNSCNLQTCQITDEE